MAEALIPLDQAVACLWPVSAEDKRLHLRILPGPPNEAQRAWLAKRNGRTTILDPAGQGDARAFWIGVGNDTGWADAAELRRELGKVDCDLGRYMRGIAETLGDAA
jgi:hypothetical protein